MKAIYIPNKFNEIDDLKKLNEELKNTYNVEFETTVNNNVYDNTYSGRILILSEHSRKDKLDELNRISKK